MRQKTSLVSGYGVNEGFKASFRLDGFYQKESMDESEGFQLQIGINTVKRLKV